ncbi:MAG TPA: prenyltransferase/squalene oxidase repeat-containing protein [Urbifossiella sp.]|nr:prenyltransferase/squalene oxidase repeat-containing protein [Urbifossiella sp.]
MKKFLHPLAGLTALGVVGVLCTAPLSADPPKGAPAGLVDRPVAKPIADAPMTPVKITETRVATKTAVDPKPLSDTVKKGIDYLVKQQQEDGGWNQGGGWRTAIGPNAGSRIEGKNVEDPSDVGNTCFALLALFRAGSTPTEGPHKENVVKGLKFILTRVEKADKDSLYVTDVRNTQLQSKIGPYVDTFLVNLVLAEMKGKAGSEEKRLTAALEKTMNKMVKHQDANGGFANNGGWAPTLSVGIANKSFARAKQNGVHFDERVVARGLAQSNGAAAGKPAAGAAPAFTGPATAVKPSSGAFAAAPATGLGRGAGIAGGGAGAGDAGVRLYSLGQGAGNSQDFLNGLKVDGKKAEQVLKDAKSTKEEKAKAQKTVDEVRRAEKENDKVQQQLAATVRDDRFVSGFGSNGGEEFLSFLNISEALIVKGGKDWTDWDAKMASGLQKAQDKNGSWSGQHCITGKTFCTSAALLVMMADRTQFPVDVLKKTVQPKK